MYHLLKLFRTCRLNVIFSNSQWTEFNESSITNLHPFIYIKTSRTTVHLGSSERVLCTGCSLHAPRVAVCRGDCGASDVEVLDHQRGRSEVPAYTHPASLPLLRPHLPTCWRVPRGTDVCFLWGHETLPPTCALWVTTDIYTWACMCMYMCARVNAYAVSFSCFASSDGVRFLPDVSFLWYSLFFWIPLFLYLSCSQLAPWL